MGFALSHVALLAIALPSQASGSNAVAGGSIQQTAATGSAAGHPLQRAVDYATEAAARADALPGYRGRMVKFAVVDGKPETKTIDLKFRSKPFSVYMRFRGPNEGREVLYIDGWNDGRMIAHEGSGPLSLVGTISLAPDSPRALKSGGRPITQAGLAEMGRGIADEWAEAIARGLQPDEVAIQRYPEAKLGDVPVEAVEVRYARRVTRSGVMLTRFYVDKQRRVPLAFQSYGFPTSPSEPPPLDEEVRYLNVDFDRVPTPQEFDPRNPQYDF